MDPIITVKNLKKSYDDIEAVKGIDFYVNRGEMFAFLGPNGAGKSTTIRILCTLLEQDDGEVIIDGFVLGKDDNQIRNRIGVMFQHSVLDDELTVRENLEIRGSFYNTTIKELKENIKELEDSLGLSPFIDRRYDKLSGGQKRRADIARALIHKPDLLFLDEPTTGLDPQTRRSVWKSIHNLQKEKGMTVFMTTHYMDEASEADTMIILDNGEIAEVGTPDDLKGKYTSMFLKLYPNEQSEVIKWADNEGIFFIKDKDSIRIPINNAFESIDIINVLRPYLLSFEVMSGTMDDVFIAVTGKELRE